MNVSAAFGAVTLRYNGFSILLNKYSVVFANGSDESVALRVCKASLFSLELLALFEFQCSRHNRSKGNVLCFGKSQQGFRFSGSRLNLEVWCIAVDNVCS